MIIVVMQGDDIDGVPFIDPSLDGVPITEDIDGVPSEWLTMIKGLSSCNKHATSTNSESVTILRSLYLR